MKRSLFSLILFAAGLCATSGRAGAQCSNSQTFSSTTIVASGNTQLIAAPGLDPRNGLSARSIHICAVTIQIIQASTAANWGLVSGTGAACATGTALVTPAFLGVASLPQSFGQVYGNAPITVTPSAALCLYLSSVPTGAVVHVQYAIY